MRARFEVELEALVTGRRERKPNEGSGDGSTPNRNGYPGGPNRGPQRWFMSCDLVQPYLEVLEATPLLALMARVFGDDDIALTNIGKLRSRYAVCPPTHTTTTHPTTTTTTTYIIQDLVIRLRGGLNFLQVPTPHLATVPSIKIGENRIDITWFAVRQPTLLQTWTDATSWAYRHQDGGGTWNFRGEERIWRLGVRVPLVDVVADTPSNVCALHYPNDYLQACLNSQGLL